MSLTVEVNHEHILQKFNLVSKILDCALEEIKDIDEIKEFKDTKTVDVHEAKPNVPNVPDSTDDTDATNATDAAGRTGATDETGGTDATDITIADTLKKLTLGIPIKPRPKPKSKTIITKTRKQPSKKLNGVDIHDKNIKTKLNNLKVKYATLCSQYLLLVSDALNNYYDGNDSSEEFSFAVESSGITDELGRFTFENLMDMGVKCTSKLSNLMQQFNGIRVVLVLKTIDYKTCPGCECVMKAFPDTSELTCKCGYVVLLFGTVFDDSQFYTQEGQRTKHGSYNFSRHCKAWEIKIQAREKTKIPDKCIAAVKKCIKRDQLIPDQILCSQIREYLKETKYTKHNDHVPLIRQIITGVTPPQLTSEESRKLRHLFIKATNLYNKIKKDPNNRYYPYTIYKILSIIILNSTRKKLILECIHLQSDNTIMSHDEIWEKICDEVPELIFKDTDRHEYALEY